MTQESIQSPPLDQALQDCGEQELRGICLAAIRATAGLAPFTLGSGRDGHGEPIPSSHRVLKDALSQLAQAGRDAQAILAATSHEESGR